MNKPLISICIPTFNRATKLHNCLKSIEIANINNFDGLEICISDNASNDDTSQVIELFKKKIAINHNKNKSNLGIPKNFLKVVSMAKGEYVWLVGDDDLILPDTFDRLLPLLDQNREIDFFYLNSFHLSSDFFKAHSAPFDTRDLPKQMEPFSKKKESYELEFFELVDPGVSFDFLGGMFLSAFRKSKWDEMINRLDPVAISSNITFSHFDNTFPHLKIWAHAFSKSKAYFNADPMNVCVSGFREWSMMEPLIRNIRLLEALDIYRKNGMSFWRYIYCKNYALRNYFSNTVNMLLNRNTYGFQLGLFRHFFRCALFPNTYLSIIYLIIRKVKNQIK